MGGCLAADSAGDGILGELLPTAAALRISLYHKASAMAKGHHDRSPQHADLSEPLLGGRVSKEEGNALWAGSL